MSGVAGVIRFDGGPLEPGVIERMTGAMAYRGPDGIRHWIKESAALGHCMLRTTPESLQERLPLANESESLILVMDGRVDNWEELRAELLGRGATLRSHADAELVLRAYEHWGADCLAHIDGDFAIALWDARQQSLFCGRDRMGNKPFHYRLVGPVFAFASDIAALLEAPFAPPEMNECALAEYAASEWRSCDETLWRGVMRLPAAHQLAVGRFGARISQYWTPTLDAQSACRSDAEYVEQYRAMLSDVVRRSARSHRQVACEVSGGLDSSAIFCLAHRIHDSGDLPAPDIAGYTLDFAGAGEADELDYARAVGAHLGRPIEEVAPTIMQPEWYARTAAVQKDFPGYPNGVMHAGLGARAASRGAVVLLTGVGGDHFLEGSRRYYQEEIQARRWRELRACFTADAAVVGPLHAAALLVRYGLLSSLEDGAKERLRALRHFIQWRRRSAFWLSAPMRARVAMGRKLAGPSRNAPARTKSQRELLDCLYDPFSVIGREQVEHLSAHAGLEVRHPFFTRAFVEFALATPERLRRRGACDKFIHRQAMKGIMPDCVAERSDKADFSIAFVQSLAPLLQQQEALLAAVDRAAWLDRIGVEQLVKEYNESPVSGWRSWVLWGIVGGLMVTSPDLLNKKSAP